MARTKISRNFSFLGESALPGNRFFQFPALAINVEYLENDEEKRDRTRVRYNNITCNVDEAAKIYFEKHEFIVLEGADVDTFLRFFLLQVPISEFDAVKDFQKKQRALVKKYLAGKIALARVIKNAALNAASFYLPPARPTKKLTSLRNDIQNALRAYTALSPEKYSEAQRNVKERCIYSLANDFLPRLHKSDFKKLTEAYTNMIKGSPPDLFVFNSKKRSWFFVEVKSLHDNLRPGQWDWIMGMEKCMPGRFLLLKVLPLSRHLRETLLGY